MVLQYSKEKRGRATYCIFVCFCFKLRRHHTNVFAWERATTHDFYEISQKHQHTQRRMNFMMQNLSFNQFFFFKSKIHYSKKDKKEDHFLVGRGACTSHSRESSRDVLAFLRISRVVDQWFKRGGFVDDLLGRSWQLCVFQLI